MLLLKLLEENDMYGYQMIEQLQQRSDNVFALKAGTLYPLLHNLEEQGLLQPMSRLRTQAASASITASPKLAASC